jgi:hypothetical protein
MAIKFFFLEKKALKDKKALPFALAFSLRDRSQTLRLALPKKRLEDFSKKKFTKNSYLSFNVYEFVS